MTTKYKKRHRLIATLFLLIFFPTLVPSNLFASNNGPKSPEAASFEPVDATDMVNLASGDMSYVLPLLNVPSPEGGYPLALSYHAGIAMDQEASWVGLGWSLNPGALNRTVNNTPDDWNNGKSIDFVYSNLGKHDIVNVGVGVQYLFYNLAMDYTFVDGKGKGGIVSFGVSRDGIGMNQSIGFGSNSGFYSTSLSINGLSISGSSEGMSIGYQIIGLKINSQGTSMTGAGGSGIGYLTGNLIDSNKSSTTNAHGVKTTLKSFNASFPLPLGNSGALLKFKFGYSKVEYSMFDAQTSNINGVLYSKDSYKTNTFNTRNENVKTEFMDASNISLNFISPDDSRKNVGFSSTSPNYDNYTASGQGIGDNIQPLLLDNKTIILSGINKDPENTTTYSSMGSQERYHIGSQFQNKFMEQSNPENNKIHFYSLGSNSSYIDNSLTDWVFNSSFNNITDISNSEVVNSNFSEGANTYSNYDPVKNRLKKQTFVETYTNEQINNNGSLILEANKFNRQSATDFAPKGIGAFKVTTIDGKTYHYSLPVYNYEAFIRSYETESGEDNKFIEKINGQPYATHWLLTAITGPDYVDTNSDGKLDDNDYGYWISFDYGKWTDSFVWKKETLNNPTVNSSSRSNRLGCDLTTPKSTSSRIVGIKQLYYLNSINTRTHSALFIKSEKTDNKGNSYIKSKNYNDVEASIMNGTGLATGVYFDNADYHYNVSITGEFNTLKLDRIVLINKKDKSLFDLPNQQNLENQTVNSIDINSSAQMSNVLGQNLGVVNTILHKRNWTGGIYKSNVYLNDNIDVNLLNSKSIKSIKFDYDYSLNKENNIGKLTLNSTTFLGKNNTSVLPPYVFNYYNIRNFDKSNYDLWGFDKDYPHNYSLKNIVNPLGGVINIEYEKDDFSTVLNNLSGKVTLESIKPIPKKFNRNADGLGGTLEMIWNNPCYNIGQIYSCINTGNTINLSLSKDSYPVFNTTATIVNITNNTLTLSFNSQVPNYFTGDFYCGTSHIGGVSASYGATINYGNCDVNNELIGKCNDSRGGIRVKNIKTIENQNTYTTNYEYNKPNSTISSGVTASTPYVTNDYSFRFPSGIMYEYVTVSSKDNYGNILEKNLFQFQVVKPEIITTLVGNTNETIYGTTDGSVFCEIGGLLKIKSFEKIRMLDILADDYGSNNYLARTNISSSEIIDNTSKIGNILSITKFNSNNQISNKEYFDYSSTFQDVFGTFSEAFNTFKSIKGIPGTSTGGQTVGETNYKYYVNSSRIKMIPSLLVSKSINQGGYTNTTYFDKYDFLTGQVTESHSVSSDGQSFKTKIIPAYIKYPEMGSKVDNITNKNMLSQTAANYSYINDDGTWKVTGVGITTWSNVWEYRDIAGTSTTASAANQKIWRKHKSYIWNGVKDGNGIFTNFDNITGSGDDGFDWSVPVGVGVPVVQNSKWKQTSEVTLYDHYSAPLEMKDINNNYASTKMDYNDSKVLAVGNARYGEMFYTGGEDNWLGSGIAGGNPYTMDNGSHTGEKLIIASITSPLMVSMKNSEHRAGKYKLSVWVRYDHASRAALNVNGSVIPFVNDNIQAGGWTLKTAYIDLQLSASTITLTSNTSNAVYYDDLMIRPVASSVIGYVYNEWDELSYIIGNNGLSTKFEYDAAGRLIKTYSEFVNTNYMGGGFKLMKTNTYHNRFL